MSEKNVKKINGGMSIEGSHAITDKEMDAEFGYCIAQKLADKLLKNSLISDEEFEKISAKNKETFSPYLSGIMS